MLGFEMAQIIWTKDTKTEDAVNLKRDWQQTVIFCNKDN